MKGFKDFLFRGNIVDLAVAVVIGTAFQKLVEVFGTSFINPLIGLAGGGEVGGTFTVNGQTFDWGAFLTAVITFVITAAVVYFVIVVPMKKFQDRRKAGVEEVVDPTTEELLTDIRNLLAQNAGPAPRGAGPAVPPPPR
ncbi:large conductance mechanosensitive channel protein MscL [Epidermidibacterium keratini]|uniref:Large conductance mechanosensitive channel protein MscL n=1 Tax=Epidermidibacterium keratini TaxID=1891644 RepID=A0A7L4YQ30_9ACTN|nr:large conductance mechanosensitive channel protein MscL [Epidermidibacterium keratini]QHC01178.1 large conductance mechanosensitive channel protein MscL [Epidermidibacterium keratini]